jgi:hypothetical protein
MKNPDTFLIIDLKTKRPVYGKENKTLTFPSYDEAYRLADQLLDAKEYLVVEVPDLRII